MKVEVICTTDDPTDSLEYHQVIGKPIFHIKVLPLFVLISLWQSLIL